MSVRTDLLAISPLTAEVQTCAQNGQDLNGMLQMAAQRVADAIEILDAIQDFIPSGSNKTTIASQITTLT